VNQASPATPAFFFGYRLGLTARLAILAGVFFLEKIFLNTFVDFDRAQAAESLGAALRVAQHWGFRFFVAFAGALALFAYVRGAAMVRTAAAAVQMARLRLGWALVHLFMIACLAPLSYLLYRYTPTDLSLAGVTALWTLIAAGAALAAFSAMAPLALWRNVAQSLGLIWSYAAVAALGSVAAMQLSQSLWRPTAAFTFVLVKHLISPILPSLQADSANLVLATSNFAVQIAEVCSGLEGVGLILAFSGAWLLYFRREYLFPRALLLVPAGVVAIFALNVVRIAVLILIGNAGFPGVAVYGFHSQAGWIAFIAVACGLVLFSRQSAWLYRAAEYPDSEPATTNPTATFLMPLLAILAAGTVARAISSNFEYFYPLRLIAGLLVLIYYRHKLLSLDWRWSWRAPVLGALIFLIWMVAAHFLLPASAMPPKLAAMPGALRAVWIASRILNAVLVVPIAEELAYRGYLMRRLVKEDFENVPFQSVGWLPLMATAIVFGAAHGAMWVAGGIAGIAFGLIVIRRGSIGEALVAHATCNALIAVSVLAADQWQLW
jgi:exosortase E/protease (VPEID-CTERM system)